MHLTGYSIGEKLGAGGMATVFKGLQLSLQRPVAIKVLSHSLQDDDDMRLRFSRESLIIARLNHPNIIHVIDQGITEDGCPFFVMEYVNGVGLDSVIRQGGVSLGRSLDICIQITKALAYAHKNGIVHRDIKPANVLVDFEGSVRVLDFGIAHFFDEESGVSHTGKGDVMGTYAYMAPEQQESADRVTAKSDLYSLGVLMYQLFTGKLPAGRFPDPRELNPLLPQTLDELILHCLQHDPIQRPPSADAVRNALLHVAQGGHIGKDQIANARTDIKKNFVLLDVIKEDIYASVYLFEEQATNTLLVIKKKPVQSPGYDTVAAIAKLKHRNLVAVHGTSRNERSFIVVMEYLSGGALADRLTRPFELPVFYSTAMQICDVMQFVADAGFIHGNLRPSNVLYTESRQIKVADFGLERHYSERNYSGSNGHEDWYSIENELSSGAHDIYAAGVMFYQMLTGELPQRRHLKLAPNSQFQQLPQEVQAVVTAMLALDVQKRPASFAAVRDVFARLATKPESLPADVPADAATVIRNRVVKKQSVSWPRLAVLAAVVLVVLTEMYLAWTGDLLTWLHHLTG
jgi:eukaryotic-like serine/threonine-protein kinase